MPIVKVEPFDLYSKQWSCYIRRVKQYMQLNDIKADSQVSTLITLVGEPTYDLMRDLCAPIKPENKKFDELVQVVADHLEPKRSVIAERHVFRLRRQRNGESLSDYLQSLKHLAATCGFSGEQLEENLRDQFVSGLACDDMRSRLFAESDISYKKAVELAMALEAAEKHAEATSDMHASPGARVEGAAAGDGHHDGATNRRHYTSEDHSDGDFTGEKRAASPGASVQGALGAAAGEGHHDGATNRRHFASEDHSDGDFF